MDELAVEVPQYPEGAIFPEVTPVNVETVSENQVGELGFFVLHMPHCPSSFSQYRQCCEFLKCFALQY